MNYIEQFMKDNDLEVGEEFYIKHKGAIEWVRGDVKYYFNENYFLTSEEDKVINYGYMNQLLTGTCKIEKIPVEPKTVWDLKKGDDYYCIESTGFIHNYCFNSNIDEFYRGQGNAFITKKEAGHEAERRKCEAILLKYGTRDMMSIGDRNNTKYIIYYDHEDNSLNIYLSSYFQFQGAIYFESEELAYKAVDECGKDRLKKYIFNVKEDQ